MKTVDLDLANPEVQKAIERELQASNESPLPENFPIAEGTYPRLSKNGERVTYTPNQDKLLANKQWVKTPKDYLNYFFDDQPTIIQDGMEAWNSVKEEYTSSLGHYVCSKAEEIVEVFNEPTIESCMNVHSDHEKLCKAHPAEAYDSEDFSVLVITEGYFKLGRLVANRKTKQYVRMYLSSCGDELDDYQLAALHRRVRAYVRQLGYTQNDGAFEGCGLKEIYETILGLETYVIPYVDYRDHGELGSISYSLDNDFRLTRGGVTGQYSKFSTNNTNGIGLEVEECMNCNSSCIGRLDLQDQCDVCQACFDSAYTAVMDEGEYGHFLYQDQLIYVEKTSEYVFNRYLETYLEGEGLHLVDGLIVEIENTVDEETKP